jgi:hypothetical protein
MRDVKGKFMRNEKDDKESDIQKPSEITKLNINILFWVMILILVLPWMLIIYKNQAISKMFLYLDNLLIPDYSEQAHTAESPNGIWK